MEIDLPGAEYAASQGGAPWLGCRQAAVDENAGRAGGAAVDDTRRIKIEAADPELSNN